MKRTLSLAVATFAICIITLTTHAQTSLKLRFQVPFGFTAEKHRFPSR
jgi:hypothetical protein